MNFISIYDIPVLLIVYKRVSTTLQVLDALEKIKPKNLYIAFNAPDLSSPNDNENCEKVKKLFNRVPWDCNLYKLERTSHLSARESISGAITWFFSMVDAGIILEDDCVPGMNFFNFSLVNLNRYYSNDCIMHISGNSFLPEGHLPENSYYFSNYCHIWGWATWKRAWEKFNLDICLQHNKSEFKRSVLPVFKRNIDKSYWIDIYDYIKKGNFDTWDTQWLFSIWKNRGYSITPNVNMVKNIGFNGDATNTLIPFDLLNTVIFQKGIKSYVHPAVIYVDEEADIYTSDALYRIKTRMKYLNYKVKISTYLPYRLKRKIKLFIRNIYRPV